MRPGISESLIVEGACLRRTGRPSGVRGGLSSFRVSVSGRGSGPGGALFRDLSFRVGPGETLTLMGPSGSGKSSLLHWICGALPPGLRAEGRVRLGARDLTALAPERRDLGLLFQDDLLLPHLTVSGNLAFGLRGRRTDGSGAGRRRLSRAARRAAVARAVEEAGLSEKGDAYPSELSGGERVRVALMRTLLSEPAALLLDEPFSSLDAALKDRIRAFVFDHARLRGLPILLVTHDAADARAAAASGSGAASGRIVRLEDFARPNGRG